MSLQPDSAFYAAAVAILVGLKSTITSTNINLLVAWSYCEKPHGTGDAWQWNNPLNTKMPGYGGSNTTVGCQYGDCVKQYPTKSDGVSATVATLTEGAYPALVTALTSSRAEEFFAASTEMSTWGTNMSCIQSTYGALGPVPAQYLPSPVGTLSTPGPSGSSAHTSTGHESGPPAVSPAVWAVLGLFGIGCLGVVAAVEVDWHWDDLREAEEHLARETRL